MKRPQYVFRPNLNEPQHRRAWALLQQMPPAKRKEFLVQSILAAEQTNRLEKSIRKVVREELQAVNINNVGFWDSIPLWAVTLIGGLLITVLSFTMILTVYGRMFSLWMYAAIAPIPLSTFAGEPTSSVGKNFIRSYAGVCLQGVVIALSCMLY